MLHARDLGSFALAAALALPAASLAQGSSGPAESLPLEVPADSTYNEAPADSPYDEPPSLPLEPAFEPPALPESRPGSTVQEALDKSVLLQVAHEARVHPSEVHRLRLSGRRWHDVLQHYNLSPNIFRVPIARESLDGDVGRLYSYSPAEWDEIYISDQDYVTLAYLQDSFRSLQDAGAVPFEEIWEAPALPPSDLESPRGNEDQRWNDLLDQQREETRRHEQRLEEARKETQRHDQRLEDARRETQRREQRLAEQRAEEERARQRRNPG